MAQSALDLIRQVYADMRAGDVPALLASTGADVIVRQTAALPWGGAFRGREGFGHFLAGVARHLDSAVIVERMIEAGEQIAVVGRTTGTIRANGRAFDLSFVHLYTVGEGRIVDANLLIDTPSMLEALADD